MSRKTRHLVAKLSGSTIAPVLLGLAIALAGAFPVQAAVLAQAQAPYASAYVVRVDGLACPFCAYGIEKQFSNVPGVTSTEVNLANGVVVVHVKPGTRLDRAQIKKTVKDAGFTLKRIVSTPSKGQ